MFTGIIEQIGIIKEIGKKKNLLTLSIKAKLPARIKTGASISVDGCCLTVISKNPGSFSVDVIPETISKTIVCTYKRESEVNIETPLKLGDTLDGHIVQGHIDFTGTVESFSKDVLKITHPVSMAKYIALKGSITINGVSLTVSLLNKNSFEVSLIPQTIKATNLGQLKKGSRVNVEIDIIARYLESLLKDKSQTVNRQFLTERGFI